MNRENKKKEFEKGYYKTHACEEVFTCKVCGREVIPEGAGSDHRNHCPNCLCSLHVDIEPGDRESDCGGIMDPIAVWVRKNGEWAIIHRCRRCGALSSNRIAADDNPMKLMGIALKPLCEPPFPVERIRELAESLGIDPGELLFLPLCVFIKRLFIIPFCGSLLPKFPYIFVKYLSFFLNMSLYKKYIKNVE